MEYFDNGLRIKYSQEIDVQDLLNTSDGDLVTCIVLLVLEVPELVNDISLMSRLDWGGVVGGCCGEGWEGEFSLLMWNYYIPC